jgi:hypothetical protein
MRRGVFLWEVVYDLHLKRIARWAKRRKRLVFFTLEISKIPKLKVWAMENLNPGLFVTALEQRPGINLIRFNCVKDCKIPALKFLEWALKHHYFQCI